MAIWPPNSASSPVYGFHENYDSVPDGGVKLLYFSLIRSCSVIMREKHELWRACLVLKFKFTGNCVYQNFYGQITSEIWLLFHSFDYSRNRYCPREFFWKSLFSQRFHPHGNDTNKLTRSRGYNQFPYNTIISPLGVDFPKFCCLD